MEYPTYLPYYPLYLTPFPYTDQEVQSVKDQLHNIALELSEESRALSDSEVDYMRLKGVVTKQAALIHTLQQKIADGNQESYSLHQHCVVMEESVRTFQVRAPLHALHPSHTIPLPHYTSPTLYLSHTIPLPHYTSYHFSYYTIYYTILYRMIWRRS